MKPSESRILTVNGGSSSIKFALFEGNDSRRILKGAIERIGSSNATMRVQGMDPADNVSQSVTAADHSRAVDVLMDWIEQHSERDALTAVGHRVVHGGPNYCEPQLITATMIEELRRLGPFDPEHMPQEDSFDRGISEAVSRVASSSLFRHSLPPRSASRGPDVADPAPL